MLGKGRGSLYNAPTMGEEERDRLRGEGDKIKFCKLSLPYP